MTAVVVTAIDRGKSSSRNSGCYSSNRDSSSSADSDSDSSSSDSSSGGNSATLTPSSLKGETIT